MLNTSCTHLLKISFDIKVEKLQIRDQETHRHDGTLVQGYSTAVVAACPFGDYERYKKSEWMTMVLRLYLQMA